MIRNTVGNTLKYASEYNIIPKDCFKLLARLWDLRWRFGLFSSLV
jgi:hypothetical protein